MHLDRIPAGVCFLKQPSFWVFLLIFDWYSVWWRVKSRHRGRCSLQNLVISRIFAENSGKALTACRAGRSCLLERPLWVPDKSYLCLHNSREILPKFIPVEPAEIHFNMFEYYLSLNRSWSRLGSLCSCHSLRDCSLVVAQKRYELLVS